MTKEIYTTKSRHNQINQYMQPNIYKYTKTVIKLLQFYYKHCQTHLNLSTGNSQGIVWVRINDLSTVWVRINDLSIVWVRINDLSIVWVCINDLWIGWVRINDFSIVWVRINDLSIVWVCINDLSIVWVCINDLSGFVAFRRVLVELRRFFY